MTGAGPPDARAPADAPPDPRSDAPASAPIGAPAGPAAPGRASEDASGGASEASARPAPPRPTRAPLPRALPAPVPFRRRTRLVAWAKVLLPLGALALLSTLFLIARGPDGSGMPGDIPFARAAEIARDPRIDAPRLSGLAPDGTAVTLEARRLLPLPGQPDGFRAVGPRLETRSEDGGLVARLSAAEGEVLGPTRTLRLRGGVSLDAASPAAGPLEARMGEVTADLASGTLTALGGVEAETRLGTLRADAMRVVQGGAEGTAAGARVVFNGAVRLVYRPPAPAPAP